MIRWSYLAPRAAVVAALLLLIHYGLSPLVHWTMVAGLRATTGVQLDIDQLSVSPWTGELAMDQLALSNPLRSGRNLATAQQSILQIETDQLLKGRLIVRQGAVHGLRIGGVREGGEPLAPKPEVEPAGAGLDVDLDGMMERLAGMTDMAEETLAEQFVSIRLANELAEIWPQRYKQLSTEIEQLAPRLKALRATISAKRNDPLQYLEMVQESVSEVTSLHAEMDRLRQEIAALKDQAQADRGRIADARRQDEARVRELWKLEGLDGDSLSEYLLGKEQKARIDSLVAWVRWIRSYVPHRVETPEAERGRGVDVVFRSQPKIPRLLIRSLLVDGQGTVDQTEFEFRGFITGLTTEPVVYGQPLIVRVESSDPVPLRMQAILDRTGAERIDQMMIDSPRLPQPARLIGSTEKLSLAVAPSEMHLWASLELRDEALSGQIILKQEPVGFQATLGQRWGGPRLAKAMNKSLARVSHVHTELQISGSLRRPSWQIRSSLGPQVAAALRSAFDSEVTYQQDRLAARLQKEVDKRTDQLTTLLESQQRQLLDKLQLGEQEILSISQLTSGESTPTTTTALKNTIEPSLEKLKGLIRH